MIRPGQSVLGTVAFTLCVLISAGCGDDADGNDRGEKPSSIGPTIAVPGEIEPVSRFVDAIDGLCRARVEARADVRAARATFYDRAHDDLHVLARFLDTWDPPAAARLLEAKQRVEAGLDANPPPPRLSDDIATLVSATRDGLEALGADAPPDCPDDE